MSKPIYSAIIPEVSATCRHGFPDVECIDCLVRQRDAALAKLAAAEAGAEMSDSALKHMAEIYSQACGTLDLYREQRDAATALADRLAEALQGCDGKTNGSYSLNCERRAAALAEWEKGRGR